MQQRIVSIYVIGPSSTGKTTLCNALAQRLGLSDSSHVFEVARQVMKEKGYSRDTVGLLQMQQDIMDAQLRQEDRVDAMQYPIRLFDRSAIDPVVYAILTSKDIEEVKARKAHLLNTDKFCQALARYRSRDSVVVLLRPIPDWLHDDGVRSIERQEESLVIFETILQELGIEYRQFARNSKYLEERVISVMGWARL